MTTHDHLDLILATCRAELERIKEVTPGPWIPDEFSDPQWVVTAPHQKPFIVAQSVGGNDESNARFIAHARTLTPAALQTTIIAIEALRGLANDVVAGGTSNRLHNALTAIASAWPESEMRL